MASGQTQFTSAGGWKRIRPPRQSSAPAVAILPSHERQRPTPLHFHGIDRLAIQHHGEIIARENEVVGRHTSISPHLLANMHEKEDYQRPGCLARHFRSEY
jgi:hypothetical protein